MAWELCTLSSALVKAGANANSTITASAGALAVFYDQAVGDLVVRTRRDWTTTTNTNASVAKAVANVLSNEVATRIINYDPNSWSLKTAQTKLDVLKNNTDITMERLKEDSVNDIRVVEA